MNADADSARRAFLDRLTQERNFSAHTRLAYARDLARLADWCDAQGLEDWSRLDHGHVRLFAAQSHAKGLGPKSVQRLLSAVRSFYAFLQREGLAARNPAADVRAPKAPRRLPRTVDADLMARVLEGDPSAASPRRHATAGARRTASIPAPPPDAPGSVQALHGAPPSSSDPHLASEDPALLVRDLAIMELFYSSGLRLSELVGLNLTALDLTDRLVTVRGKGDKTRIVPVGSRAVEAIRRWLAERAGLAGAEEPALFVGRNGRRLGARAVQLRIAAHARRQGLPVHLHPHLFRHSFASHLLESSHDLRGVQELLGHANLATTQVYTHLDFQHLAHIYDQAHPRARRSRR